MVVELQHGLQFVEAVVEVRIELFFQVISIAQDHVDCCGLFVQRSGVYTDILKKEINIELFEVLNTYFVTNRHKLPLLNIILFEFISSHLIIYH